jgi:L,D-transpeptidase YcbB
MAEFIHGRARLFWIAAGALGFAFSYGANKSTLAQIAPANCLSNGQLLTDKGAAELHSILASGEVSDLHRPNFHNFQTEVQELYGPLDTRLAWVSDSQPNPQALAIIARLKKAEDDGLDPEDYDASRWDSRLVQFGNGSVPLETNLIHFDVALTVSVMRYVSDLHDGRLNPRIFHVGLDIGHTKYDLSQFVCEKLVGSEDVSAAFDEAEPPFPGYHRTLAALKTYLKLAREDSGGTLPEQKVILHQGEYYRGTQRLAKLLKLLGDLPQSSKIPRTQRIYQGPLVRAVRHFQNRHGLATDGRIGPETLRELNVPLSQRVIQLQLALERWRWLPHQFERPPIVVNIPEFNLHVNDESYHWVMEMKVVVGQAYENETPVFAGELRSIIFRPEWNVPISIARDELVPEIEKNPAYLGQHDYEIVDAHGNVMDVVASDEKTLEKLSSGELLVRQKPGPNNALGLVKFNLPNPYGVYLHGTPSTELFSQSRRDFSHGCIRVEDPVALAAWLLRDQPEWSVDRIRAAMNGPETIRVMLDKPVPILIIYATAVVTEDGVVHFADDIYGYDSELEQALANRPN